MLTPEIPRIGSVCRVMLLDRARVDVQRLPFRKGRTDDSLGAENCLPRIIAALALLRLRLGLICDGDGARGCLRRRSFRRGVGCRVTVLVGGRAGFVSCVGYFVSVRAFSTLGRVRCHRLWKLPQAVSDESVERWWGRPAPD